MAIVYNTTIDQGADWFINFIYNQPALITNMVQGMGTDIVVTANNGFVVDQVVSITGVLPSQFNYTNAVLTYADSTQFIFQGVLSGIYISGGTAYAPVNLTSATAALQLRSLPNDPTSVLTLTTENDGITIGGIDGELAVHATAEQTGNIDTGYYYYDLQLTLSESVIRVAQGQILVSAEITRV